MKVNWRLFFGFGILYVILAVVYWKLGGEAVGITAMGLSGGLAGLIGYYLWFVGKRTGGILPEDSNEAEIADGAGELGFYSPHSWWPLPVALSTCAAGMGLIIGWWLTVIAVGSLIISVIGFVTEYEKPSASSH